MLSDFHLHTLVSDGALDPAAVVRRAAAAGVTHLSITDHDALDAYSWEEGRVFAEAARLGLELTVGIEMDADLEGLEVAPAGIRASARRRPSHRAPGARAALALGPGPA